MVKIMKKMGSPSKGPVYALPYSVLPTLHQATAGPCLRQRLLDTHGQVWVSLFWGHCSFLLDPGTHKVLFVPSKSLFPQSCVSSGGSMMGLMVASSKRAYAIPRSAAPRAPAPAAGHCWPVPPQETLKHSKAGLAQSLRGLLVHTRFCLSPPSVSVILSHPAYLTYMHSKSCEMPTWMKHRLESRLLGEISTTSDMHMTPPLRQKAKN